MHRHILFKTGALVLLMACLLGCEKSDSMLDPKSTSELNEESVFSDVERSRDFLINIYTYLRFEVGTSGYELNTYGGSLSDMTDESDTRWPGGHNVGNQIIGGTFGTAFYTRASDMWTNFYTAIRQVNIYLRNVDRIPVSDELKSRTAAEARFLRAYFYHKLMCYYGGVILVGDEVYDLTSTREEGRDTYAACVEYIVSEMNAIAPMLPLSYSGSDYGRITRGAALSLKARVLLYAASPLYNGNSSLETGSTILPELTNNPQVAELVSYPSRDNNRWQAALQAAKEVADLGVYSLYTDNTTRAGNGFYQVFLDRVNPEYIMAVMLEGNKFIEANTNPPSRGGAYYRFPTQEMVDAFPMKNGLPITDNTSGYDESKMYENRDPRFYYTVIYNGAMYWDQRVNTQTAVYTYVGANLDGLKASTVNTGTVTGYYVRKMANEYLSGSSTGTTYRCMPVFRYAEILLMMAEANVETGNIGEAMDQLIELRKRAGIEPGADLRYGIPADPSTELARAAVRKERFIELAFEEHRYWDLRRWGLGAQYDGKYVHGINIVRNSNGTYNSNRFDVRAPRYFKINSYFFPIPTTEIAINRNILQNPGW
ncbi:MAG: RagB/SusD family nutrient uptake outer membrane protein [Candidatus Pseudobacter hemicellulosilyticus]|uniref:RagB/SusD family nutrient uptake outer membrane protein n=1 Tax=Candidatus Pseudobacter hemicellulosilyticus TaxID=3121375 RepID=A0AAJ5WVE7_9BACT|nr:MAG: RagB/SusD family nutrient uptake outer membrane protein [Pseudobacter sp.]